MLAELPDDIFVQIVVPIVSKRTVADLRLTSKSFNPQLHRISAMICPKPNYFEPHTNAEYLACLMHKFVNKSYFNKTLQQHMGKVGLYVRNYAIVKDCTTNFVMKNLIHAITLPRRYQYFGTLNRNYYLYHLINSKMNINTDSIEDLNKYISDLVDSSNCIENHEDIIKIIKLYQEKTTGTAKEVCSIQLANQIFANPNDIQKSKSSNVIDIILSILMANFPNKVDSYVVKLTKSNNMYIMKNAIKYGRADLYETYKTRPYYQIFHDQTFAIDNNELYCYKNDIGNFYSSSIHMVLVYENYPISSLRRCKINLQHILKESVHLVSHYINALSNDDSLYQINYLTEYVIVNYIKSVNKFAKNSYVNINVSKVVQPELLNKLSPESMSLMLKWKEDYDTIYKKRQAQLMKWIK